MNINADRAEVRAILETSDVWDMTLPYIPAYWQTGTLERYRRSGYTFVSATVSDWPPTFSGTERCIAHFREVVEHDDSLLIGSSSSDIEEGRRDGKLLIGLNAQETRVIEEDLSRLETLHDWGIRHMLLAYNVRNLVADGCAEAADAGLSNFGRQVVREMNRVGIIVDGSHTGRRSSLEAIELSERVSIFSHTGAHAVYAHIRNIHDDQIRACADSGGVVGVVGLGAFIGDVAAQAEAVFRHIDYIAGLVGPEHVGIGTDYVPFYPAAEHEAELAAIEDDVAWPDPANAWPNPDGKLLRGADCRCFQPEQLTELVSIMIERGYPVEAIRGILGANFRRVYASVEDLSG